MTAPSLKSSADVKLDRSVAGQQASRALGSRRLDGISAEGLDAAAKWSGTGVAATQSKRARTCAGPLTTWRWKESTANPSQHENREIARFAPSIGPGNGETLNGGTDLAALPALRASQETGNCGSRKQGNHRQDLGRVLRPASGVPRHPIPSFGRIPFLSHLANCMNPAPSRQSATRSRYLRL